MKTINRRQFLATTATVLTTSATSTASAAQGRSAKTPVVDTHVHCFAGSKDARFPYHPKGPYQPAAASPPELLLKRMDEADVDFAVIVHPEPYQDDNRYLEHCLDAGKGRFKGTLLCFADRPGSLDPLPRLAKRGDVVAARVHAYAPDRLPPFGKPELRALWRLAADHGLAMQLHFEPRFAAGFEPLIREFRDTKVLIDHLGRPLQATPEEHALVVRWAKLPNTHIKLSALGTPQSYPHRDLRPHVENLLKAYGPTRMLYGGGFDEKATGESYRAAREYARSFLAKLTAAEQAAVLGGNAASLLGFKA
jgi:predicted TIM-barrel fold metal-dependent hydrolase